MFNFLKDMYMQIFLLVIGFVILVTFLMWVFPARASAQDGGGLRWRRGEGSYYLHTGRTRLQPSPRRRYPSRSERPAHDPRCLGEVLYAIGQESASEDGALKSAERNWGALVRYDLAEKFMDLKYAEKYSSRCQRSSTGESATAKVLESVTGGTVGTLYRCKVWAEPCTAPKTTDGARDR